MNLQWMGKSFEERVRDKQRAVREELPSTTLSRAARPAGATRQVAPELRPRELVNAIQVPAAFQLLTPAFTSDLVA